MVDDKYEPARTTTIVKRFVERDNCFAIVAALGSAPTAAVVDYIVAEKVPLVGPGTGAAKILEYQSKYVFPLYPSYKTEGAQLVRFVKEVFNAKTVAVLYQNDPSGKTEMDGINSVLTSTAKLVSEQGYQPKELDVSAQVVAMKNANPDAIICACAPEPAASSRPSARSSAGCRSSTCSSARARRCPSSPVGHRRRRLPRRSSALSTGRRRRSSRRRRC